MSVMPAGEYPLRTAEPERAMTYGQLESRLVRLERLEMDEAATEADPWTASHGRSTAQATTSVLFSDEPCEGCGGLHEWSRVRATPTPTP